MSTLFTILFITLTAADSLPMLLSMMDEPLILLVDDDRDLCRYYELTLKALPARVILCHTVEEARRQLHRQQPDLLLADLELPDGKGLELLCTARNLDTDLVVTLITGKGTIQSALEAMKNGAFDYLLKPLSPTQLRAHVNKALSHRKLLLENRSLRRQLDDQNARRKFIGNTPSIVNLLRLIDKAAPTSSTILITGESGTGKELVARMLHAKSRRSQGPFIAVNCAALPETLLESELFGHEKGAFTGAMAARRGVFALAHHGTLLLDEIGTMPSGLQAKLLRVLEEGRFRPLGGETELVVDVRVIAATNANLDQLLDKGQFREDLYFRLNVIRLQVPALRDRLEDLPELAEHFLKQFGPGKKLASEFMECLKKYHWPGNVRELSNVIERACLISEGPTLSLDTLPREVLFPSPSGPTDGVLITETLAENEKRHILRVLEQCRGQRSQAAERLGISRRTLYNKLREYGVGE